VILGYFYPVLIRNKATLCPCPGMKLKVELYPLAVNGKIPLEKKPKKSKKQEA